MILSRQHGFIFMKTLKTAGTSVEIALSRVCGPEDVITPLPAEDEVLRRERGGRPPQNYESPPLPHRVTEHIRAGKLRRIIGWQEWSSHYRFAIERNPWDAVVSLYFWVTRNLDDPPTFEEYLAGPRPETLAVRNFQMYHFEGKVAVDRVLRYEHLADDLAEVWHHLGLPGEPDLPRAKGGARPAGADYRRFYTEESAARVAELFAQPIQEMGYSF
ncbi:hypothetical protein [Nocardioides sp. SYSU D00038]|uniref:hypothetical protein n=1 Tax=Nocardioides sp. SYSU D00038 TaxID=2812554 RepID=UPI001967C226|nr:hypothetical protein [Nocardioides sp. SYSU D00038]